MNDDDPLSSLVIYVAGPTQLAQRAIETSRRVCEQHFGSRYTVEIVDVIEDPARAEQDHILATPTFVSGGPKSSLRLVGDLSSPGAIETLEHLLTLPTQADTSDRTS